MKWPRLLNPLNSFDLAIANAMVIVVCICIYNMASIPCKKVTAKLICASGFTYACCWFSHVAAHTYVHVCLYFFFWGGGGGGGDLANTYKDCPTPKLRNCDTSTDNSHG